MPEVILCQYCKLPISKDSDDYVLVRKATDRFPEELAHVACEQKPRMPFTLEEWMKVLRWPRRS
jgi:hypothetical protein